LGFNGPAAGYIEYLGGGWLTQTIYVLDHKGVIRYKDVRDHAPGRRGHTLWRRWEAKK